MPTFAAVQSWAGADQRARVIAAVNVLNAAFIVGGTLVVAALQSFGVTLPQLFLLLGVANLVGAGRRSRSTMPTNGTARLPLHHAARVLPHGGEGRGEPRQGRARTPIIALNHVSFLDAAVALSLMDKEPVFAIDYDIAQRWWVKPFLKLTRAMPLDPTQADGDAHADQRREGAATRW